MARTSVWLTALLVMLIMAPSATAEPLRISEADAFHAALQVPSDPGDLEQGFLLLSGALDHDTTIRGPVFASHTDDRTRLDAELIRVYNVHDPISIAAQQPLLELTDARVTPDPESAFLWSTPEARATAQLPYTFAFLFQLERNLPEASYLFPPRDGEPPASLVAQAHEPWHFEGPGTNRSLFLPITGGFRVTGADGTEQRFDGDDWLVSLRGNTTTTIAADGIAVPFASGAEARMTPASGDAFAAGFSVERLESFLEVAQGLATGFSPPPELPEEDAGAFCADHPEACAGNRTGLLEASKSLVARQAPGNETEEEEPALEPVQVLPPEVAESLTALGPFLNGAFFGRPDANITVDRDLEDAPGFTLVRFTELTLTASTHETVFASGAAPFAFTGGSVHHDTDVIRLGPLVFPLLSIALYVLAIGAWAATRVWTARPEDEEQTERLRLPARLTQWGLLAVAFILFDREVDFILGQSILGSLGLYGNGAAMSLPSQTMAFAGTALIIVLQVGLWAAASAAFGLPIAILGRSALKAGGLGRATYGFAIGLGALATWLLGTQMILPLMDVAFGAVSGAGG